MLHRGPQSKCSRTNTELRCTAGHCGLAGSRLRNNSNNNNNNNACQPGLGACGAELTRQTCSGQIDKGRNRQMVTTQRTCYPGDNTFITEKAMYDDDLHIHLMQR